MQTPIAPPKSRSGQPWVSVSAGILGLLILPAVVGISLFEPSSGYPEPWHTVTHYSALALLLGAALGIVALVLGIQAIRGQRAPLWAAIVGTVTGALALAFTGLPAIGVIVSLIERK